MTEEYWLITYEWEPLYCNAGFVTCNDVHRGTIGQWMVDALSEPGTSIFLNAAPISESDYVGLNGRL